jgi:hypothetical protein
MIDKKYRTNVILCLVGLLFVGLTVASAIFFGRLRDKGWEEAISLEEVYASGDVEVGTPVYFDIVDYPAYLCKYDEDLLYYFAYNYDRSAILLAGRDWYDDIVDGVAENGTFRVIGTIQKIDKRDIEELLEGLNEGLDPEGPLWDEENLELHYGTLCLRYRYPVKSANLCLYLSIFLALCAFLCLLPGIMGAVNFRKTRSRMSEADRYIIESEIKEPGTITLKSANVFLTSRHLIFADTDLVILRYEDIVRAYRADTNYRGVHTVFVTVIDKEGRKKNIAMMNAFQRGVSKSMDTILEEIRRHNPEVIIGEA